MKFEFIDELPPRETRPNNLRRDSGAVMDEFAAALRQRPGVWAKWPTQISAGVAGCYTANIRQGRMRAFGDGFDAVSRNGVLYVQYIGTEVSNGRA